MIQKIIVACAILVFTLANEQQDTSMLVSTENDYNQNEVPRFLQDKEAVKNKAKGITVAHLNDSNGGGGNGSDDNQNSDSGMSVSVTIGISIGSVGGLLFCCFIYVKIKA